VSVRLSVSTELRLTKHLLQNVRPDYRRMHQLENTALTCAGLMPVKSRHRQYTPNWSGLRDSVTSQFEEYHLLWLRAVRRTSPTFRRKKQTNIYLLLSYLSRSPTLGLWAVRSSETSVNYQTTRTQISGDRTRYCHRREGLKSNNMRFLEQIGDRQFLKKDSNYGIRLSWCMQCDRNLLIHVDYTKKNSVPTSLKTRCVFVTNPNQLILFTKYLLVTARIVKKEKLSLCLTN
jgi:hypothetical protein